MKNTYSKIVLSFCFVSLFHLDSFAWNSSSLILSNQINSSSQNSFYLERDLLQEMHYSQHCYAYHPMEFVLIKLESSPFLYQGYSYGFRPSMFGVNLFRFGNEFVDVGNGQAGNLGTLISQRRKMFLLRMGGDLLVLVLDLVGSMAMTASLNPSFTYVPGSYANPVPACYQPRQIILPPPYFSVYNPTSTIMPNEDPIVHTPVAGPGKDIPYSGKPDPVQVSTSHSKPAPLIDKAPVQYPVTKKKANYVDEAKVLSGNYQHEKKSVNKENKWGKVLFKEVQYKSDKGRQSTGRSRVMKSEVKPKVSTSPRSKSYTPPRQNNWNRRQSTPSAKPRSSYSQPNQNKNRSTGSYNNSRSSRPVQVTPQRRTAQPARVNKAPAQRQKPAAQSQRKAPAAKRSPQKK